MSNVTININVDRHRSGNSRIHGKVGERFHDINVWKGPEAGDCYLEGQQNGETTTLRFNSAFSDNGQAVFGRLAGAQLKGNWAQDAVEGDVELSLNKARLTVDQNPSDGSTRTSGTRLESSSEKTNAEGDETLNLRCDGQRYSLNVDRQSDGDIEVRGRSGDGPFRFQMQRRGVDGDLRITGNIPEKLALTPVMWELFGDDSLQPPARPLSFGAAASVGAFFANQLSES